MARSLRAAHWQERLHPRDDDGKFARKGGQRWMARVVRQFDAAFGDTSMAQPGMRRREDRGGLIDTGAIARSHAGFNRPVAVRHEASLPGLAGFLAEAVAPKLSVGKSVVRTTDDGKYTLTPGHTLVQVNSHRASAKLGRLIGETPEYGSFFRNGTWREVPDDKLSAALAITGIGKAGKTDKLIRRMGFYTARDTTAESVAVSSLKKGDHARVTGIDQYGKPISLNGYVQNVGPVTMRKGRTKTPMHSVSMAETPSGGGANWRGTVYTPRDAKAEHTASAADVFAARMSAEVGQRTGLDTPSVSGQPGRVRSITNPPAEGRPAAGILAKRSATRPEYLGWDLDRTRDNPTGPPNVVRSSVGFLDGEQVVAEVHNPDTPDGPYRYRIYSWQDGRTVEEGQDMDLAKVRKTTERIFSSQRGEGMARTAGKRVRFEARRTERPKNASRGDMGKGPFYDFDVYQVDQDGVEHHVSSHMTMGRAQDAAGKGNDLEVARLEREGQPVPESLRPAAKSRSKGTFERGPSSASSSEAGGKVPIARAGGQKTSGKARKGDLVVVSRTTRDYVIGKGSQERTEHSFGVVESVDRQGNVKSYRPVGYGDETVSSSVVKLNPLRETATVGSKDRVDVQAAMAAAKAHHWPGHPGQPKAFDTLAEATALARQHRIGSDGKPVTKAATPAPSGPTGADFAAETRAALGDVDTRKAFALDTPRVKRQTGAMATTTPNARQQAVIDLGTSFSGNPYMKLPKLEALTDEDFAGLTPDQQDNVRFLVHKLTQRAPGEDTRSAQKLQERFGPWPTPPAVAKKLGDMTPAERDAAIKSATGRFQTELTRTMPAIAKALDEADQPTAPATPKTGKRTTTVTLPDGTVAKRTSQSREYTHAVVVTRNERAAAASRRKLADRYGAALAALNAWEAAGADPSQLIRKETGRNGRGDRFYGGFLPGFESSGFQMGDPQGGERYPEGTSWDLYGPAYVRGEWTRQAARLRDEADALDAGPEKTHYVGRWSSSRQLAEKGRSEFEHDNTTTRVVEVDRPKLTRDEQVQATLAAYHKSFAPVVTPRGGQPAPITPTTLPTGAELTAVGRARAEASGTAVGDAAVDISTVANLFDATMATRAAADLRGIRKRLGSGDTTVADAAAEIRIAAKDQPADINKEMMKLARRLSPTPSGTGSPKGELGRVLRDLRKPYPKMRSSEVDAELSKLSKADFDALPEDDRKAIMDQLDAYIRAGASREQRNLRSRFRGEPEQEAPRAAVGSMSPLLAIQLAQAPNSKLARNVKGQIERAERRAGNADVRAAEVATKFRAATTREDAHAALEGLTVAQLKAVAKDLNGGEVPPYPSGANKAALRRYVVEHFLGFKLDHQAVSGGSWVGDRPEPRTNTPATTGNAVPEVPMDRVAQVRAVSEYASMTRSQFDALPDERKQAALAALRAVAALKDEESYTIPSNRTTMGTTIRGMRTPQHIEKARSLVREFTRVIEPAPDNSTAGRVARLRDATSEGQVRAALGSLTIPQMDELARAAGYGGVSTSWNRDRVVEHFLSRALAGKDTQTYYERELLKVESARLIASLRNQNAKTLRNMAIQLGLDPDPDELKATLVMRVAAEVERRRAGKA